MKSLDTNYTKEPKMTTSVMNLRNVPIDLHRTLKARAAMEGKTLEQLVIELLSKAVK